MGCWNATCGVTQLPILSGESVRLFLLTLVNPPSNMMSYCSDMYHPTWFPVAGVYNDYGSVEDIMEDWNSRIVHTALMEQCVGGSNDSLEEIISQIERGDFKVKNNIFGQGMQEYTPGIFMVRENVYQQFINSVSREYWSLPNTQRGWDELLEETIEEISKSKPDGVQEAICRFNQDNPLIGFLQRPRELLQFSQIYHSLLWESDDKTRRDMVQVTMDFIRFGLAMSSLRKTYIPQTGAGSQEDVGEIHAVMANLYADEIQVIKRYYGDDE